jgi:hypothetical protein
LNIAFISTIKILKFPNHLINLTNFDKSIIHNLKRSFFLNPGKKIRRREGIKSRKVAFFDSGGQFRGKYSEKSGKNANLNF